jgi:hypothetical protein
MERTELWPARLDSPLRAWEAAMLAFANAAAERFQGRGSRRTECSGFSPPGRLGHVAPAMALGTRDQLPVAADNVAGDTSGPPSSHPAAPVRLPFNTPFVDGLRFAQHCPPRRHRRRLLARRPCLRTRRPSRKQQPSSPQALTPRHRERRLSLFDGNSRPSTYKSTTGPPLRYAPLRAGTLPGYSELLGSRARFGVATPDPLTSTNAGVLFSPRTLRQR